MKKKRKIIWLTSIILLIVLFIYVFICNYMFGYAFIRAEKPFIKGNRPQDIAKDIKKLAPLKSSNWNQLSVNGNLKLKAKFYPAAKKTNKSIVVFHGYAGSNERMADYILMFHRLGYNVLAPNAQAAGNSEGKIIGYGWLDHFNNLDWIDQLIKKTGGNRSEVALFGVSMGGSTVMFMSGLHLPKEVKVLVEDCGYSSIKDELSYQLKSMFHLPAFPLVPSVRLETMLRGGYDFYEGDAIKQLNKNKLPILFIHGSQDKFVPFSMVYRNYEATKGPKKLWVVKGAAHAKSYQKNPKKYQAQVGNFIKTYMP